MNEQVWWYLARASGIVAWVLVTAAVLWGLTLSTRLLGRTAPPAWLLDLHRHLGAMAVVFTGLHMGALVADNYVHFDLVDLLVPFASGYQRSGVAWGVVAMWLLAAVEVSSLLRSRLRAPTWRWIHRSSWLLFVLATVHGLQVGTDVTNPAYRWVSIGSIQVVLFLTIVRILAHRRRDRAGAAQSSEESSVSTRSSPASI